MKVYVSAVSVKSLLVLWSDIPYNMDKSDGTSDLLKNQKRAHEHKKATNFRDKMILKTCDNAIFLAFSVIAMCVRDVQRLAYNRCTLLKINKRVKDMNLTADARTIKRCELGLFPGACCDNPS